MITCITNWWKRKEELSQKRKLRLAIIAEYDDIIDEHNDAMSSKDEVKINKSVERLQDWLDRCKKNERRITLLEAGFQ